MSESDISTEQLKSDVIKSEFSLVAEYFDLYLDVSSVCVKVSCNDRNLIVPQSLTSMINKLNLNIVD